MAPELLKAALIIVDLQEDFCPPNGALAVPNGRDTIPIINHLLTLPFTLKIATKDWHPPDHTSFASNHPNAQPFHSTTTITHPTDPSQTFTTLLWPDHCIQNSPGASLVPHLDISKVDHVIEKGQNKDLEMYSAFYDPFKGSDSGLVKLLREKEIEEVFVVGLAFDYCVRCTAIDARREGFRTWVVGEGTRAVYEEKWAEVKGELEGIGIKVVSVDGEDVGRVGKIRESEEL